MTRSYSQRFPLECSHCQTRFTADLWLIVDSAERPDLWARCLDASIHVPACPNGHTVKLDAPLLIHDAHAKRLWFAPAETASTAHALEVGHELVDRLYAAVSPEALDEIPERVELVAYRVLPLQLRGLPVPASLANDRNNPGRDSLQARLQQIAGMAQPTDMPRRAQLCREALQVIRRRDEAERWAWLNLTLGQTLSKSLVGNHRENVEEAIRAFDAALQVYTRAEFPAQWAEIRNGMGNAYSVRVESDRAANLEDARVAYEDALDVYAREAFPKEWAMVQNNLGNVYADRIRGDRAQNIERAIHAYELALEVRTREAMPADWAQTIDNLGHVYADRVVGDRAQNIERAIQLYRAALEVRTREASPEDWAATQINLGNAYAERQLGEPADNLEDAISAYQAAGEVYTPETAPERWAILQLNLSTVYVGRVRGDAADNLENALSACERALGVCGRETSPLAWAAIQNNLATLYRERTRGVPAHNYAKSVRAYEAALEVYVPDRLPNEARRAARNLAQVHIERRDWDRAYAALGRALDAASHLYGSAFTDEGRTVEIVENVLLYQQMVVICQRLSPSRPFEALVHAEEGRSRLLRDQLATLSFPAPSAVPPELIQKEAALLRAARNCEEVLRRSRELVERQQWIIAAAETRAALASVWDTLARDYDVPDYVALRRGETIKWQDIQNCLSVGGPPSNENA